MVSNIFLFSARKFGEDEPILTVIFFKGVETTNQFTWSGCLRFLRGNSQVFRGRKNDWILVELKVMGFTLSGGKSNIFLFSARKFGEDEPILTVIFFKGVETTNQFTWSGCLRFLRGNSQVFRGRKNDWILVELKVMGFTLSGGKSNIFYFQPENLGKMNPF